MKINIYSLIGENAVSYDNAKVFYDKIKENIHLDKIIIDFDQVAVVASPFFNGSIGLLLKDYSVEELIQKFEFKNIKDHHKKILNIVIHNAIQHYSN